MALMELPHVFIRYLLILTGTPGGVGVFRKPPLFLKHGDEVVVEIEGLGRLTNKVQSMTTQELKRAVNSPPGPARKRSKL